MQRQQGKLENLDQPVDRELVQVKYRLREQADGEDRGEDERPADGQFSMSAVWAEFFWRVRLPSGVEYQALQPFTHIFTFDGILL